ncbi:MAG: peptide deformylase [Ruminococcus sp.]|nr:peptide deformylase [Ruminococcus sp.]
MVRELVHDPLFLGIKSKAATKQDAAVAQDLLETLTAHRETCVGMAANMIGKAVSIIAFSDNGKYTVMHNPEIISKAAPYETEEGCLSLLGEPRKTKRYKTVKVKFQDGSFQWKTKSYSGFTAQIIQHEIDHCNGVLI